MNDNPLHTNLYRLNGTTQYGECQIEHYDNNGGVVLRSKDGDVLIWMHVSLIGFSPDDNREPETQNKIALVAGEIFRGMIAAHNHAYHLGEEHGKLRQIRRVKGALEI